MQFTVFYAWQSDRPNKYNRSFIQKATERAIKAIAEDITIEDSPRLDQDTKGVSGMPTIADTILRKIEGCGVFLADLTFVGETEEADKHGRKSLIPNANVMLEFGYALNCVGEGRIIGVLNEAYGSTEDLPFDLQHKRWPIRYRLDDSNDGERNSIRDALSADIEEALRAVIQSGTLTKKESTSRPSSDSASDLELYRENRIQAVREENTPVPFSSAPPMLLHVVPLEFWNASANIDMQDAESVATRIRPIGRRNSSWKPNYDGFVTCDGIRRSTVTYKSTTMVYWSP